MKLLSQEQLVELREALSHMHVAELKAQLEAIGLSIKGFNKSELIDRLMHYADTGKERAPLNIPAISRAQRGKVYPLQPQTIMLYGAYKNDYATRLFFKQLIGNHFHFTAQGIDWLRERWLAGNPPTYAEFAHEWQDEYLRNQKQKQAPKQEWAYIRFTQEFIKKYPDASKSQLIAAWEERRSYALRKAQGFLNSLKANISA